MLAHVPSQDQRSDELEAVPDDCPSELRFRRATVVVWRRHAFDVRVNPVENWTIFLGTDTHKACAIFFPVHNGTNVTASLSERTVSRISVRKKRILTYVQRFPVYSSPVYNERNHAQSSTHALQTGKWSVFPAQFRHEVTQTRVRSSRCKMGNHIWNKGLGGIACAIYFFYFNFSFWGERVREWNVLSLFLIRIAVRCCDVWRRGFSAFR